MTTLASLISINVWHQLPDELKLGCADTLVADFHPDNENAVCLSRPEFCAGVIHHLVKTGQRWRGGELRKSSAEVMFKAVLTGEYDPNPRLGQWLQQNVRTTAEAEAFEFLRNPPAQTTVDKLQSLYAVLTSFNINKKARKLHTRLSGALMAFESLGTTENVALPVDFWQEYWRVYRNNLSIVYKLLPEVAYDKTIIPEHWIGAGLEKTRMMAYPLHVEGEPDNQNLVQRIRALSDSEQCSLLASVYSVWSTAEKKRYGDSSQVAANLTAMVQTALAAVESV